MTNTDVLAAAKAAFSRSLEEASAMDWASRPACVTCCAPRQTHNRFVVTHEPWTLTELAAAGHDPACARMAKACLDRFFLLRPIARELARSYAEQSYHYFRLAAEGQGRPETVGTWRKQAGAAALKACDLQIEYVVGVDFAGWDRWSTFLAEASRESEPAPENPGAGGNSGGLVVMSLGPRDGEGRLQVRGEPGGMPNGGGFVGGVLKMLSFNGVRVGSVLPPAMAGGGAGRELPATEGVPATGALTDPGEEE